MPHVAFLTQFPRPLSFGVRKRRSAQPLRPLCCASAPQSRPSTAAAVIEKFWELARKGSFSAATNLFSPEAVYYDTLYPSPFEGRDAIAAHLVAMETAMPPPGLVFVLDDLAPATSRVGARWHAETPAGKAVPFTRGASMYSVIAADDDLGGMWITEAWDFPETPLKFAGVILPVLRAASQVLRWAEKGARPR